MTTTIKVSAELRDRLKAQATRAGLTLGAHLERLAAAEDRRQRMNDVREAMASTPPDQMKDYLDGTGLWEQAESGDAPSAR